MTEQRRRDALDAYQILDTPSDINFDNITLLAAHICDTPIALISFIDAERLWYKSRHGFELEQVPREVSFCARAVEQKEDFLEVSDARLDDRFKNHPVVSGDEKLVSYAGAVLRAESGARLGTLSVMDRRPRELDDKQRRSLRALADQVEALLEAHRNNVRLAEASRENESERRKLQMIFDVSDIGMALVREPDFVFEQVNGAFMAMASPREYLRRGWKSVFKDAPDLDLFEKMSVVYNTRERYVEHEKAVDTLDHAGHTNRRYFNITYDWIEGIDADQHGILIQAVDVTADVTSRRMLDEQKDEVRRQQEYLEITLKSIGDAVISTTAEAVPKIRFMNRVAADLTGYTPEEAMGLPVSQVFNIVNVRTRGAAFDPVAKVIRDGVTSGLANHTALIARDGTEYVIEDSAAPIVEQDGRVSGVVLVFRDVTDSYAASEQVRLLSAVVRESRDLVALTSRDGRSIYINPAGRRLVGLAEEELNPVYLARFFEGDDGVALDESKIARLVRDGHWDSRLLLRGRAGTAEIPCAISAFTITDGETSRGKDIAYVARDLRPDLERDRLIASAHAEVAESRQRLAETLKMLPVSVAFLEGPDHRYTFVNEVHSRLFGGRSNFVGRTVLEAVPEVRNHRVMKTLDDVFRTGTPHFEEELRVELVQADGTTKEFYLKVGYQPMRDLAGEIYGIVSTAADVTSVVRSREEVLRKNVVITETQRLLSEATRVARVGFYEWRIPENVVYFSEQMQRDWDVPAGLPLEKSIERIHPGDRDQVIARIKRSIETGQSFSIEYRLYWPESQKIVWIEAQGKVSYDEQGEPITFLGTSIDITSRKTVETDAQAMANTMAQLAWMADADGTIFWFNQRWYEYTGTTFEQMRGWGWRAVHDPDHLARVIDRYTEHMKSGEPWEDTFPLRSAEGKFRWFLSRAVPIRDDGGNVVRWFGTNTDITVQREAEANLTRMAAVIESCKDFIAITDSKFRPIMANVGARAMIGLGDRSVDGMAIADWFVAEEREFLREKIVPHMLEHGYWEGEARFRAMDSGRTIPVLFNLFPVKNSSTGETIAYATVTRNISERKAFEQSLSEAKEAAERANLAKSAFLANMSHEIRSPLGAIMGFSDLLRGADLTEDDFANFIEVIQRNATHLLRIVDDILDLSKVEAGKMLIENIEFSLRDLLADFTSLMSYRARDKGIEFTLKIPNRIPEKVKSDPTRLRQILTNVVGNAVKFTERGHVCLSSCFEDGQLEFKVEDTGPGIQREHAERLFRPFEQADASTTRKFGGTGLGLVLTRRLAESMGGVFKLQSSRIGQGSTFYVSIAVGVEPGVRMIDASALNLSSKSASPPEPKGRLAGLKILVIEDSPDNQELFRLILTRLGAVIEIAGDGVEGVKAATKRTFDAILCDVQMPRMDGYEATRELRRQGFHKPIIALTAHAMKEERDRALASGFTDFLSKPLHKELMVSVLLKHVRKGEADSRDEGPPADPV